MTRRAVAVAAAWVMLCIVLALVGSRMQPMQSPDENQHVARAWLLADGQWRLHAPAGQMSGGAIDANLNTYILGMLRGWAGEPELRTPPARIAELRALRWRDDGLREFAQIPGTGYYLPLVYAPQALGLTLGSLLGWTIDDSYRLARLLAQMSTAALLVAAWLLARPWRPPALALGLLALPMSLFQFAAPTIDGITTGLAMVALALSWRHTLSGERLGAATIAALATALALLVTTRLHALPMLALPLLLAWRLRQPSLAMLAAGLLALAAAWTAWAAAGTVDTRVVRELSAGAIVRHHLTAPWEFAAVVGRTLAAPAWREFMGSSFVGVLGWLDTPLPPGAYRALGLGLLGLAIGGAAGASLAMPHGPMRAIRLLGVGMALVSALIVFAALLAAWTPHPATIIQGMQGRYLLLPALLASCALLPALPAPAMGRRLIPWTVLAIFAMLSLVLLLQVLQARYGA